MRTFPLACAMDLQNEKERFSSVSPWRTLQPRPSGAGYAKGPKCLHAYSEQEIFSSTPQVSPWLIVTIQYMVLDERVGNLICGTRTSILYTRLPLLRVAEREVRSASSTPPLSNARAGGLTEDSLERDGCP